MHSLGKIVRNIKAFHSSHQQLGKGSFHYGFLLDLLVKDKNVPGPIMVVTRESKTMGEYNDGKQLSVIIADAVHEFKSEEGVGFANELDVDSNTELMGMDLVEWLKNRFSEEGLTLEDSETFEPFFYSENSHRVSGWRIPITVKQTNTHSYCAIPMDDDEIPEDPRFVNFTGVSGGAPNEVYTSILIGGAP